MMKQRLIALTAAILCSTTTHAAINILIEQVNDDVVISISGSYNLDGLVRESGISIDFENTIEAGGEWARIGSGSGFAYTGATLDNPNFAIRSISNFAMGEYLSGSTGTPGSAAGFNIGLGQIYFRPAPGGPGPGSGPTITGDVLDYAAIWRNTTLFELGYIENQIGTWNWGPSEDQNMIITVVPEPSQYALILGGCAAILLTCRRRLKRSFGDRA